MQSQLATQLEGVGIHMPRFDILGVCFSRLLTIEFVRPCVLLHNIFLELLHDIVPAVWNPWQTLARNGFSTCLRFKVWV